MYLYRAINEYNLELYKKGKDIVAKTNKTKGFMESAAKQVSNGSDSEFQDCWISTTKDFRICASEYAIPQNGKYNTANCEKEIIIIDGFAWRGKSKNYSFNGNYTIFRGKKGVLIDIGDKNKYPIPKKNNNKCSRRYINNKMVSKKLLDEQIKELVDFISNNDVETGLLDLSYPSPSDRGKRVPVINELSLIDYLELNLVDSCQKQPIASGIAKSTGEVLVLNKIPHEFIKKKLSKIETMVLYALNKDDFEYELENIINGKLKISINNSNVCVNGRKLSLKKSEYKLLTYFLVDYACEICKNNKRNLIKVYEGLKNKKRNLLQRILSMISEKYTVLDLQDDTVLVKRINFKHKTKIQKSHMYDLLAIQDINTGKVISYKDKCFDIICDICFEKIN